MDTHLNIIHLFPWSTALLHTRHQLAVGQGGFHAGQLISTQGTGVLVQTRSRTHVHSARPFRYVYDCGSRQEAHCRGVIARFLVASGRSPLDLLFISHFDDDHVNGVPSLLDGADGVRVDTVVMPFVDAVERLIAFGRASARSKPVSAFFSALVIEPDAAFAPFRPRRIVMVRSGPDDPDGEPIEVGPADFDPESRFRWKIVSEHGLVRGSRRQAAGLDTTIVGDRCWVDVTAGSTGMRWMFKPYVRATDPTSVRRFEREAEKNLGWTFGTFRTRVEDHAERETLVSDRKRSRALADAYRAVFRNRNLTSLCIYSGPDENFPPGPMIDLSDGAAWQVDKIGWLGTGDAPLGWVGDAIAFVNHFSQQRSSVATYALPHHGAKPNHSLDVLRMFSPRTCWASAKPPSLWKHPHPDVIADVKRLGSRPVHVSDRESSELHESFLILQS
jgi:hypothetical protein